MSTPKMPPVDNPISSSSQDVLGRAEVARDFARSIREIDPSEGLVVGVLGAWGHGKSSFVNLMREEFGSNPEYPTIDFNPWLFSGSLPLTEVFFREVAAELRIKENSRFSAIAEGLDKYGDVLSPIAIVPWVGAWWDRALKATKTASTWWNNRKKGSRSFRDEISSELTKLENPIVIVIDDIDRLTTQEIRDVFKLVRVTASFPNVIYLLAFDRLRVEQALTEDGVPGRSYLEKIIQLSFDLPAIPREVLRSQVLEKLQTVLDNTDELRFNQDSWSDVYFEVVEPLIGSLRDVTRLTLSARSTVRALGGQIEVVDLLALESIRIFRPEIFEELQKIRTTLTYVSGTFGSRDTAPQKAEVDRLLEVAGGDADVIEGLIERVFPAALQYTSNYYYGHGSSLSWKREHRVAHLSYLDMYFARTAPADLIAFTKSEMAYSYFADERDLGDYLDTIDPTELEDVISGLEAYQDEYPAETVVPASVALLNRIHKIPERTARGMFDFMRPHIAVGRVVVRLLNRIEDETEREHAIASILPKLPSYSTRAELIRTVGHRKDSGDKLVSESFALKIETALRNEVLSRHSPVPDEEWDLLRTYWWAAEEAPDTYEAPQFTNPVEIRALVKSASHTTRSQSSNSRKVHAEERLSWEPLVKVFGSEKALVGAITKLRMVDGDTQLVHLAEKYARGWRPEPD